MREGSGGGALLNERQVLGMSHESSLGFPQVFSHALSAARVGVIHSHFTDKEIEAQRGKGT